jgi:hypothetical protein
MYFLETIPGNNSEYLLFNLEDKTIQKNTKSTDLPVDDIYCFDLYKAYSVFGDDLPYLLDLQSLGGLKLDRKDLVEELFDEQDSTKLLACKEKIAAHIKSYASCKINVSDFRIEELIPQELLDEYYTEKLVCIKKYIEQQENNIYIEPFYRISYDEIKAVLKLHKSLVLFDDKKIKFRYNIFGSKNSRLSMRKNSVNIFNLHKDKRQSLQAPEGYTFCQVDFKNFQPRLALSIFGDEEIKQQLRDNRDLYTIFEGDREANKIELISWMFSNRKNDKFETKLECIKEARRKLHLESKSGVVLNDFGRPLFFSGEEDNVVFQNYICSVEADCILSLILESQSVLQDKKTYLAFPFHDCLVFCVSDEEINEINDLKYLSETYLYKRFGLNFPVSVKVGKNFGSLQDFT